MKRLFFFWLLFMQCSTWAQSDTARFVIRTYGFQSWDDYDAIEDSIATNWDIMYFPVAGCLVTDEFIDSINRLNEATYQRLEIYYGANWRESLKKAVDSTYKNLLFQKENTFREITNCTTDNYSLKASKNLSQNRIKLTVASSKANVSNNSISIIGLQNIDSTILYRGYENFISLEFGAYEGQISIKSKGNLFLMDTCLTSSKIQFSYRVPGSMKIDTLIIETSDGQIHQQIFNVKNLETPKLYLNDLLLDSVLKMNDLTHESILSMRMEKTCLIPEKFTIHNWEITFPENNRYIGSGSRISSSVIRKLKKLQPGSNFCIQVIISSKDCVLRKKITCVSLI